MFVCDEVCSYKLEKLEKLTLYRTERFHKDVIILGCPFDIFWTFWRQNMISTVINREITVFSLNKKYMI